MLNSILANQSLRFEFIFGIKIIFLDQVGSDLSLWSEKLKKF